MVGSNKLFNITDTKHNDVEIAPAPAGGGGLAPTRKNCPLDGAVARVFPNVSLAMCPLKLSLAPYLLDSGAGTAWKQSFIRKLLSLTESPNYEQKVKIVIT